MPPKQLLRPNRDSGFWLADEQPDDDPVTSEGLFVYTGDPPTVRVAMRVRVTGVVSEYRPGCVRCGEQASAHDNLTVTELAQVTALEVLTPSVPLPPPVRIGPGGRMPPRTRVAALDSNGDVEARSAELDPVNSGLDFFESLEGMRVLLPTPVATGPTLSFGDTKEVALSLADARSGLSARGGLLYGGEQGNDEQPERFFVSSLLCGESSFPELDVGDGFSGELMGVLDYGHGRFVVLPSALPPVTLGGLAREQVQLPSAQGRVLDVATFNVENLGGDADAARFEELAAALVHELGAPDLVALEEVQDDKKNKSA